jgi:hypothetical protein
MLSKIALSFTLYYFFEYHVNFYFYFRSTLLSEIESLNLQEESYCKYDFEA